MNGFLIELEPVLFRLGPFTVRWFGLLLLTALASGLWLTVRLATDLGLPTRVVLDLASWALPLGFLGARLFHVAEHAEYYLGRPAEIIDLGSGGLSIWGGLALGGITVWLLCRRRGLKTAYLADASAAGLALSEAIGRLACFTNGDGQGRPSDLPWATRYSSNDALTPDYGVPRHPAQVYQGLADLAIFGLFWLSRDARLVSGIRFWLWLGLYGASRLLVGLVRLDPPFLFGLQQGQLIGLAAVAVAAFAIIRTLTMESGGGRSSEPRR